MVRGGLKLITGEPDPRRADSLRLAPLGISVLLALLGGLATWLGADEARHPLRARDLANETLQRALREGNEDPQVTAALLELRRYLGRHPLDSKTRVVYAGLLLGMSRRLEDAPAPVFHALRAAELAPATVPVIRSAASILAHAGEGAAALGQVRSLFGFSAANGAETLFRIEPLLLDAPVRDGLPDSAEAWVAWSAHLEWAGRSEEAEAWLRASHERWPSDLPALERLAELAARRRDWDALEALFPPDRQLPGEPGAARALLYRSLLEAARGDLDAAREGVQVALELDGRSETTRYLAGAVYESVGDVEQARGQWNRALFSVPSHRKHQRKPILLRLARLEDEHGRPAAALRFWESLLEIDPEHAEARRRVDDLAGFER